MIFFNPLFNYSFFVTVMAAEILLYDYIDQFSASNFVKELNTVVNKDDEITVRICTDGGDPSYMFAMISKLNEMPNKISGKVDGKAYSGGAYALCYMDNVECIETSEFLFHRAAYPQWYESNPDYFDEATRGNLDRTNKSLRKAMEAKLDIPAFERITKTTLDQLFSMDTRKDVYLTAKQAKAIGLVDNIVKITPQRKMQIETAIVNIASKRTGVKMAALKDPSSTENKTDMEITAIKTLEDLKTHLHEVYEMAIAKGVKKGKKKELKRVQAWLPFAIVDLDKVKVGIKSKKKINDDIKADFVLKAGGPDALKKLAESAAPNLPTTQPASPTTEDAKKEAKKKELDEFEKQLDKIGNDRTGKS